MTLSEKTHEAVEHKQTVSEYIAHHIQDSNEWHVQIFGKEIFALHLPHFHIHIPLINIDLDMSISLHVLMMMIAAVFLILIGTMAARKRKLVPTGLAGVMESLVLFIRDEIAIPNMGDKSGRKFTPFLTTMFLFILTLNLMGLIPLFSTATANLSVTVGFATVTLGVILIFGMKENGIIGFWKSLLPHGVPLWITPILFPIEVISILAKAFALSVRLFANMLAGHMVVFYILGIIIIFGQLMGAGFGLGFAPISLGLALFIDILEILVSFIQAYIFTILSALFYGMYMHPDH
ncbi:MAG: F0F1 ATP synthase subunit A [Calditrichia bacterium]|nr:F0F1 ATP synthase subunit A [Calditrichia bacterium]